MTGPRPDWNPESAPGRVGPVGGTTRLRRSGTSMDRGTFTDRVMVRVAAEPTPSPGRVLVRSVRHLALRDALAAFAAAWRLAFEPAAPVSTSARASAAALFLSVVIVFGLGGAFVSGGALSLLGTDGTTPQELAPGAAPTESPAATVAPSPSPSPTVSPSQTPSPSPRPVVIPSATRRPPSGVEDRSAPETREPGDRGEVRKKRETPEPKERERDDGDEREADD